MITIVFGLLCVVVAFGIHVKASKPEQDFVSCVTDGLGVLYGDVKLVITASKSSKSEDPKPDIEPQSDDVETTTED